MQITSNLTTNISDNFNSELNDGVKSVANKQASTSSGANSEISENQAQPAQPFKYQQYNSLESNYFKSLLNSALLKKTANINSEGKGVNQVNNQSELKQSTGIRGEYNKETNVEPTKAINESTKSIKDSLYTEWKDGKNEKVIIPRQNDYNDIIRRTTEDPNNAFPELQAKELKGLIAKESTFNSKAVSPTGRKGLVQMDENTAKSQGELKFDGKTDPRLEPEKAIAAVPKILNKKYKYLESNENKPGLSYYNQDKPLAREEKVKFALAAYNAGEGQVKKALNKAYDGKIPPDGVKFEDIRPFLPRQENREYVPLILEKVNEK